MDRYLIRVRVARPGSQTEPRREALGPRAVERMRGVLEAVPGSQVVTVAEQADAVVGVFTLATWDRAVIRQLARAIFGKTTLRGSIAASYNDDVFFQLATPGGSAALRWQEGDVPQITQTTTGEETR